MNPETEWSTREKLAIASYVLRSGEQHWSGVGRLLRPLGEPDRPGYWFSPKFCAQQYTALLENEDELPKRKRNTERSDSSESLPTLVSKEELIVRRLTKERIDELKRQLRHHRAQYRKRKQELEMVEAGTLDDKLEEIWENLQKEENSEEMKNEISHLKSEDAEHTPQLLNEDTKKELDVTLEQIAQDAKSVVDEIKSKVEKLAVHSKMEEDSEEGKAPEEVLVHPQAKVRRPSDSLAAENECMEQMNEEDVPVMSVQNQEFDEELIQGNEEDVSLRIKDSHFSNIGEKLRDDSHVPLAELPDTKAMNLNISGTDQIEKESSFCENERLEGTKNANERDASHEISDHNATADSFAKSENPATGIDEDSLNTGIKHDEKRTSQVETAKEEDSGSSSDELNVVSNSATLPKTTTVEDSTDLMEENESVYNYSMDEESSSYQQQMSQPGTPMQFSCDSFPSSPALSHSSDLDPETVANCKAWRKSIMILWKQVASHRYASLFLQPVTDDIAPNYSTTVHRTMDLSTLKKNIENGAIRTTSEFQRDLMLMFQNAIMYNNRDHVYRMTMEMQKDVMDQVAQFLATQLMVETAQPASNKSLRRSTMRRSAISNDKISEARSKRVAAIEGEAKLMRKKQPSHE